jgi:hypothetical protein
MGAAFFLFFTGYGIVLFFSTANSFLQSEVPDHLRGRLMGLWGACFRWRDALRELLDGRNGIPGGFGLHPADRGPGMPGSLRLAVLRFE